MSLAPRRLAQFCCVAIVLAGLMPWAAFTGRLLGVAVESHKPLTMSVLAWLVMLVPLWVAWFATSAWSRRDESAVPALLMAAPPLIVTALFLAVPGVVPN